jgi:hypothetical protein
VPGAASDISDAFDPRSPALSRTPLPFACVTEDETAEGEVTATPAEMSTIVDTTETEPIGAENDAMSFVESPLVAELKLFDAAQIVQTPPPSRSNLYTSENNENCVPSRRTKVSGVINPMMNRIAKQKNESPRKALGGITNSPTTTASPSRQVKMLHSRNNAHQSPRKVSSIHSISTANYSSPMMLDLTPV